ncbi:hypothetical protein J6590_052434 [Homalodisca vitripennis]|nr:hypothetical protein J6590_052434 [Homalodisca vitripennis]
MEDQLEWFSLSALQQIGLTVWAVHAVKLTYNCRHNHLEDRCCAETPGTVTNNNLPSVYRPQISFNTAAESSHRRHVAAPRRAAHYCHRRARKVYLGRKAKEPPNVNNHIDSWAVNITMREPWYLRGTNHKQIKVGDEVSTARVYKSRRQRRDNSIVVCVWRDRFTDHSDRREYDTINIPIYCQRQGLALIRAQSPRVSWPPVTQDKLTTLPGLNDTVHAT